MKLVHRPLAIAIVCGALVPLGSLAQDRTAPGATDTPVNPGSSSGAATNALPGSVDPQRDSGARNERDSTRAMRDSERSVRDSDRSTRNADRTTRDRDSVRGDLDRDSTRAERDRDYPRGERDRDTGRYERDRDTMRDYRDDRDTPRSERDRDTSRYDRERDYPRGERDRDYPRYERDSARGERTYPRYDDGRDTLRAERDRDAMRGDTRGDMDRGYTRGDRDSDVVRGDRRRSNRDDRSEASDGAVVRSQADRGDVRDTRVAMRTDDVTGDADAQQRARRRGSSNNWSQEFLYGEPTGDSWLPVTTEGYVQGAIGQSKFDANCLSGFACDETDTAFKLSTGGTYRQGIGLELSYVNLGKATASGGALRAQGLDFSVVGNLPITETMTVFAKLGTIYGWTKADASIPTAPSGDERGFGLSYGAGAAFDVSPRWAVVGEWNQYRFDFPGADNDVRLLSAGLRYKF